jgi:hypothetical protein
MRRRQLLQLGVFLLALTVTPGVALAHGFGSRYELSLPRWLFISGGAGVVLVSFAIVSAFAGRKQSAADYTNRRLAETPLSLLTAGPVVAAARFVTVALLVVGVAAGFLGPADFNENLLTNLIWVGFWVGYTFSVIFVGNTWPALNPWRTTFEWAERVHDRVRDGDELALDREYRYGSVPALIGFLAFAWLEVIGTISQDPRAMAVVVVGYSVYLWLGMYVYGTEPWLSNADPFTRLYAYLGKFAPLAPANDDRDAEIRMYGVGLVEADPSLYDTGALAFLVALLYTVTFDGFLATPEWRDIALAVPATPVPTLSTTLLMLLGVGLFLGIYQASAVLMQRVADTTLSPGILSRRFALSLLPIAIVYQVSHFYTFLLIQGQFLVLALSDPLGRGWDLLGVAAYEPATQIPFVSVQFVWQSQVALIVIGHIIAAWVAHHIALDRFETRRQAVRSQIPMIALMVVYTLLSLWILTRPVVDPPIP